MNIDRIKQAHAAAREAFAQLGASYAGPSLDALFVAAYLDSQAKPKRNYTHRLDPTPPARFIEKVKALGECAATASSIWQAFEGSKPTAADAKQCGTWLRAMGFKAHKSSGRLMFTITRT